MKKLATYLALVLLIALTACKEEKDFYSGYVEGDYVYISPSTSGILKSMFVERGQQVAQGDELFSLDKTNLEASRLSTIADIEKAKSSLASAKKEYVRVQNLVGQGAVSQSEFDTRKEIYEGTLSTVKSAEQKLVQIEKQLAEAAPLAPTAGFIEDTYYNAGEFVAAGTPVIAMLPPQNIKLRFFVPQAELAKFTFGAEVTVDCDGCNTMQAKINFISSKSEYTPPVIYSVGSRDKLVFMIEAKTNSFEQTLRPGLPVDIKLVRP